MTDRPIRRPLRHGAAARQRGAVLYVAMIMLVLLALIGIVGMQVASMQERMSANYRTVNLAFQNAEGIAREAECSIEAVVNRSAATGCAPIVPSQICDDGFEPSNWAKGHTLTDVNAVNARLIGPCISGNTSLDMGGAVNEDPNPIYQVTAYATDQTDLDTGVGVVRPGATSASVVDTIFRP